LYSTCIFCHSALGKNEAVEHFPVGRRLAFDGAKGRLWVVCAKCGRWNLTPIEERWEAIEECEKQYRGTKLRAATDEIGLGKLREGLDLIRLGAPLRPEFAAWRYGRHFEKRRRNSQIAVGAGIAAFGTALVLGAPAVGMLPSLFVLLSRVGYRRNELGRAKRFIHQRAEQGFGRKIKDHESVGIRMIPSNDEQGWALRFAFEGKFLDFLGNDAVHTAHLIAPAINSQGGSATDVDQAVRDIENVGSPDRYFKRVLNYGQTKNWHYTALNEYPKHIRLAFEMASHEETERAAMEGELQQLENDWREAEEIAAIADNMFLPKSVSDFIARHSIRPQQ
jgi:hypothetical protein